MELHLGMDEEPTKSLWVRIKGRAEAGTGDITVGVCYRPPDQEDLADEALYRQIGVASLSQTLVFMREFNHLSLCGTTQQGISNLGGSCNELMITSFSK